MPAPCDQLVLMGREDCLYLNVFAPKDALAAPHPLPVMIYIHGGGYYMGGAYKTHGFQELLVRGVVVVTLQYRLGLFGFLSTEDEAAPGNQGLKDQTLALQWVKDNIEAFGGDTTRAIHRGHYAERHGTESLGAGEGLSGHRSSRRQEEWNLQPFYIGPRVDGDYLPEEPAVLLQRDDYYHVPAIMGVNRDEMAMETVEMYTLSSLINSLLGNFSINGPASLHLHPDEEPVNTTTTTYNHYLGGLNITKEDADNLTQMYTDHLFLVPHDWTTRVMSATNRVFTYELHHRGEYSLCNQFLNAGLDLPQALNYIAHGDNNQYLAYPKYGNLHTEGDKAVGEYFVNMWANFATTGDPTPDDSLGFTWEMTEPTSLPHLNLQPHPFMETDQRAQTRAFWESLPLRINNLLNH
ncbi:Venom carboxylesterase-6 [Chionoecetes opilio]|uniref:Venom carboxylesterase-6 n=1 Tax=Chionoecetes opilio TaxID=41210 RepID=A0A8J5D569_CHIOP|nr:Venom carboxylesterase-6 [Chionoecetes opilio]